MKLLSILLLGHLMYISPNEDPSQAPSLTDVYYRRPTEPVHQYVKVELVFRDNLAPDGGQLRRASFNKKRIPLRPTDFLGNRGTFYFKVKPGNYEIRWTVRYPKRSINRQEYRQTLTIADYTKKMIYVEIKEGDFYSD